MMRSFGKGKAEKVASGCGGGGAEKIKI